MNRKPTSSVDGVSRRSVLAAGAVGAVLSTSGCIDRVQSVVGNGSPDQLSLSIMTVPADADRQNVRIARHLESNLEAVGINVSIDMRSRSEFLEAVLLDHEFDCYIHRYPGETDPDFLYEMLHSTYASEAGWQNPFGFTSIAFDRFLEDQRQLAGEDRRGRINDVLQSLAQEKPFEPICIPTENRIARTDRFQGWDAETIGTRSGYLGLDAQGGGDRLHALSTDSRMSRNLNPLSASLRKDGTAIDLLYDSLATDIDGELTPWLAESWEWLDPGEEAFAEQTDSTAADETVGEDTPAEDGTAVDDGSDKRIEREQLGDHEESEPRGDHDEPDENRSVAEVTLRENCFFHDGEPVSATDVAFTYRFLADTALGQAAVPLPAPRYRSQASAIESVTVENDVQLTITTTNTRTVAERAFAVPILPAHRWRDQLNDRIEDAERGSLSQGRWSLMTTDNVPAVGSGPYQFESNSERNHLTLERFDEHFTRREDVDLPGATAAELRFSVDPGSRSSVDRVAGGDADVTASMVGAHAVGAIPDRSDVQRLESPSRSFYHLGFNTRKEPFSNSHFRRAVAQLIDKQGLTETVFYDQARPVATPVTGEWVPDELAWNGEDPVVPFAGSDGELDVEQARDAFTSAGYRYDENGTLLRR